MSFVITLQENITIWERNNKIQQQQQQQQAAPQDLSKTATTTPPGAAAPTDGAPVAKAAPTAPLVWDLSYMPEERLAFCLADGRAGVLSVRWVLLISCKGLLGTRLRWNLSVLPHNGQM